MKVIHLPKIPKMHKPGFMKKKTKDDGEKTEDEDDTETTAQSKVSVLKPALTAAHCRRGVGYFLALSK